MIQKRKMPFIKDIEELIDKEDFLSPELQELRSYVLNDRNEDIAFELNLFEERYLCPFYYAYVDGWANDTISQLSEILNSKISWKEIKERDHETKDGFLFLPYAEVSDDNIKFLYLRGVLEVQLWCPKEQKQKTYPVPDHKDGSLSKNNQFFYGEPLIFSLNCMKNFWEKFQNKTPEKRPKTKHFFQWKLTNSKNKPETLYVYARPYLVESYYDESKGNKNIESIIFSESQGEMKIISCQTENNSAHAGIINFISWQDYLHIKQGGNPISNLEEKMITIADDEKNKKIPPEINDLFQKMVQKELFLSDLPIADRKLIKSTEIEIPKIKFLLRYIHIILIRLKKNREFLKAVEVSVSEKIRKSISDLFSNLTTLWPDPVPASDLSKKEADTVQTIHTVTGYRTGNEVVLLDADSADDYPENAKNLIQAIQNKLSSEIGYNAYKAFILTKDNNDQWYVLKSNISLDLPLKVEDPKSSPNSFVLVIGQYQQLKKSVDVIIKTLNGEKLKEKVFNTIIAVAVEIPQNQGATK